MTIKKSNLNYEDALSRLGEISTKLQSKSTTLDEGIKLYQEGLTLAEDCIEVLQKAKGKITIIKKDFAKLLEEPFEEEYDE